MSDTYNVRSFVQEHRIRIVNEWADDNPNMSDMPGSSHWKCTLRRYQDRRIRRLTVPFSQGPAFCQEPTAEDVLNCLASDAGSADRSFEEWAGDYGYDTDSRKAEKTYTAVTRQTAKLRTFLGEDLFDKLVYHTEGL